MYCLKHTTKILEKIHVYYSQLLLIYQLTETAINDGCNLNRPVSHIDKITNNNTNNIETTIAIVPILNNQ